jgi:hypothetical protein
VLSWVTSNKLPIGAGATSWASSWFIGSREFSRVVGAFESAGTGTASDGGGGCRC